MAFFVYDLIFLVVFSIVIGLLLYRFRRNLKREGIMYLYRAQWGVNAINYVGKNYRGLLRALSYPIIALGFVLMAGILYLISNAAYIYLRFPDAATSVTRAPPVAPVIPYFTTLFGLESLLPPFYFTHFIVALAIVAFVHEFSHGIFMVLNKVRIRSTGIVFLGPILGAFVEQNDTDMQKIRKRDQMTILAAGVFANVMTSVVFFIIWMGIFSVAFAPVGVTFTDYKQDIVPVEGIERIGSVVISDPAHAAIIAAIEEVPLDKDLSVSLSGDALSFTEIVVESETYYMTKDILMDQLEAGTSHLVLYEDYPALRAGLRGTITSVDGRKVAQYSDLVTVLDTLGPGDEIIVETLYEGERLSYTLTLGTFPDTSDKPFLGISNAQPTQENLADSIAFFKEPFTDYTSTNEFLEFLYYLVFWIVLINFFVALFNMLPVSILDGGRFFYLTVWGVTGNEKVGAFMYKWVGIIILALFVLMMVGWVFGIS